MPLQEGDVIKTNERRRAFIDFPDDSKIIMEPNTRIKIEERGIFVWYGRIWFWRFSETAAERFDVRTAYVTASVTGSWWALDYVRGGHRVESFSKKVRLESNMDLRDPVDVNQGQSATFQGNDEPQVRNVAPSQRAQRVETAIRRQQAHSRKTRLLSLISWRPFLWTRLFWGPTP